jgi:hypothetical protein
LLAIELQLLHHAKQVARSGCAREGEKEREIEIEREMTRFFNLKSKQNDGCALNTLAHLSQFLSILSDLKLL